VVSALVFGALDPLEHGVFQAVFGQIMTAMLRPIAAAESASALLVKGDSVTNNALCICQNFS
jgi:hypothetical protein